MGRAWIDSGGGYKASAVGAGDAGAFSKAGIASLEPHSGGELSTSRRSSRRYIVRKHRFITRWTHWVNFPVLLVMIWSGLLIYWANDVYRFGIGPVTLFHFFPDWVYRLLNIDHRLADGMAIHFLFMWIFAINGVLYIAYTAVSGAWREMIPGRSSFRDAIQVALYDLHLSKCHPPQEKYNAAQKISYTAIVLMGFGSLVTGIAIYRPTQMAWLTTSIGGYQMARWEHFMLTAGYVAFFGLHIMQVIRAGWNNFRSMVTGFEVIPDGPKFAREDGEADAD